MNFTFTYLRFILLCFATVLFYEQSSAQGSHVFGGSEAVNFGQIDLATGGGTWSTARTSPFGYFSAFDAGTFTGASDGTSAYIDGYAKLYRGSSTTLPFTFPVGVANDLRSLTVTSASASDAILATAWGTTVTSRSAVNTSTGIISVSNAGQWEWQDLTATQGSVNITVSIPDMSSFATAANLRLVGFDGSQWINLGTTGAASTAEGSALSGSISSTQDIIAIGIGSVTFVLPLRLVSFNGSSNSNCTTTLKWQTADESNTSHFEIESSSNASTWISAGRLTAQGNGAGQLYSFVIAQTNGTMYYRLKMADADGSFVYSHIAAVSSTCTQDNSIRIFPNPVTYGNGKIAVVMNSAYRGKASVILLAADGKIVSNTQIVLQGASYTSYIETTHLPAGTYILRVNDNNGVNLFSTQKVIKN